MRPVEGVKEVGFLRIKNELGLQAFNELHLEIEKRLLELLLILQIDEEHLHQPAALLLLPIPAFLLLELEAKLLQVRRVWMGLRLQVVDEESVWLRVFTHLGHD